MLRRSVRCLGVPTYQWCSEHSNKGVGRLHALQLDRGEGSYLYDTSDKKYLDFACGIGVTNLGHNHPRLVSAATKQLGKLWHGQVAFGIHSALSELMEDLTKVMPYDLDNFSFVTTGAEAVEAALKIAKQATGRQITVVMQGSYHGRTHATLSMTTSKYNYSTGLKPLMPGVTVAPIPYTSQMKLPADADVEAMSATCLAQLEDLLFQTCHPSEVCQIVVEPVLGEGGYLPLPKPYLEGIRKLCDQHGILMTMDEVQTGFGRTGALFTTDLVGVRPDILIFAKGIACGMPIAGVATTKAISDKCIVGTQGGTYAANAVACATASEVLKVMKDEGIIENVKARSEQIFAGLDDIIKRNNLPVQEVRGRGLMVGLQFVPSAPAGIALEIAQEALKRGLMIMNTSKFEVLRFIPPLNVSESEMKEALNVMEETMVAVVESRKKAGWNPETKVVGSGPCCAKPCYGEVSCRTVTKFE